MTVKKYLILFVLFAALFFVPRLAETETSQTSEGSRVTLTWQDLQNLLDLKSDKIQVTWKEFQKLLKQTGMQIDMDFQVDGGIVTIKREQFKQILAKMKPFIKKAPVPPADYLVCEAKYTGTADKENSRFTAEFKIYLFEKETPSYVQVPILAAATAVSGIFIDGKPGVMQIIGNQYYISLTQGGYHHVKAVFSVGNNKQSLYLPVIRSIINIVDFTVPFKDYEIVVPYALDASVVPPHQDTVSRIAAYMPSNAQLSINWNRKRKEEEKKPALFYADTHNLISVAPDILRVKTLVDLEVLQSSLDSISLLIPPGYETVNVVGNSIKNWQVRDTDAGRVLEIHVGFDINGNYQFSVFTERILADDTLGIGFSGIQVIDARRETGDIGIVAESAVEVEVQPAEDLEQIQFHQLPRKILAMSSRPILYSYKYSRHPYRLDIAVHKFQPLEGISTVIESADAVALLLEEGKLLYKTVYTVRNSYKQFMQLELPENASVWTVLVGNKREKASRNKEGKVLIPLVRSSGNGDQLKSFKVELIYTQPFEAFHVKGGGEYFFPKTDIFINKIRMELFLPRGYSYSFDKGEWREEVVPVVRGDKANWHLTPVGSSRRDMPAPPVPGKKPTAAREQRKMEEFGADEKSQAAVTGVEGGIKEAVVVTGRLNVDGTSVSAPVKGDMEKKARQAISVTGPAGLSSISVHLPISGVKHVFSKKIIDKYETYPLRFSYIHKPFLRGIYVSVGFLVLLFLAFFIRARVRRSVVNRQGLKG